MEAQYIKLLQLISHDLKLKCENNGHQENKLKQN
jgi:hypothetical protein